MLCSRCAVPPLRRCNCFPHPWGSPLPPAPVGLARPLKGPPPRASLTFPPALGDRRSQKRCDFGLFSPSPRSPEFDPPVTGPRHLISLGSGWGAVTVAGSGWLRQERILLERVQVAHRIDRNGQIEEPGSGAGGGRLGDPPAGTLAEVPELDRSVPVGAQCCRLSCFCP